MIKTISTTKIAAAFILAACSQITNAETIKYEIIGTVSDVAGPLQGDQVSVGDSVTGHFLADNIPTSDTGNGAAWYSVSDLVLDIGASYQLTSPTGAIQVYLSSSFDNISFHFTDRGNGLTGPSINDNWSPDYFNQSVNRDLQTVALPLDMGLGGQDVSTYSHVRFNIDDSVRIDFSIERIAAVENSPAPTLDKIYYGITGLEDMNNNGTPEVAFLRTVESGNIHVLLRDAISRDYIKTMTFFNADYAPLDIAAIPDGNSNGHQEIAVMAINTDTGKTHTIVKDSFSGERLTSFSFSP